MKNLVYSLSIIALLASCNKLDEVKSSEDKLREGKWKMIEASATYTLPYSNPERDTTTYIKPDSLPECQRDNYLVFGDNYNGYMATNEKKCTPGEPEQIGFNWGLEKNDRRMYIYNSKETFGTPSVNAAVTELTDNRFTLKYYYPFEYPNMQDPSKMITDTIFITTTFSKF